MGKGTNRLATVVDTSIEPASYAIGQISFADNSGNRKVYLSGLNAGIDVVMQYWKNGTCSEQAEENLKHIKETLIAEGKLFSKAVRSNGR